MLVLTSIGDILKLPHALMNAPGDPAAAAAAAAAADDGDDGELKRYPVVKTKCFVFGNNVFVLATPFTAFAT